tara:strand:- start:26 stop:676 length:651 start_codon:yes stop_codon:yes gene_type:complete
MSKKKPIFVTFEGIEGSGKSYQCRKLFLNLKKRKIPIILTREPGGTIGAENIRRIILDDYFHKNSKEKFDKYTDTLLYLAARNEHVKHKIIPSIKNGKNIICDRFVDSTISYQVFGKGVDQNFINYIHKYILGNLKTDLTFVLKVKISKAFQRLKKRKKKNRYDKFSKKFYIRAQNAFIKIAKKNKNKYFVIDNSKDSNETERAILNKYLSVLNKK